MVMAAQAMPAPTNLVPEKEAGALQAGLAEMGWTATPRGDTELLAWSWGEQWSEVACWKVRARLVAG